MDADWFARVAAERRAGNLTRTEADALRAFGMLLAIGDDKPSESRIANDAGCSKRTVQRAKVRARELGLLAWERRFAGQRGLRRELTCCYQAATPPTPVIRRERQNGKLRRRLRRSVEAQLAAFAPPTAELLALQAARRIRMGFAMHGD